MRRRSLGRSRRQWRLSTLADFWSAAQCLDEAHRENHHVEALSAYLNEMTHIVLEAVDRYARCLWWLDAYTGGILSSPQTVKRLKLNWPEEATLLGYFDRIGKELREFLEKQKESAADVAVAEWQRRLNSNHEYKAFMTRLIHQFGNYEVIAMALPGTGPIVTDRRVQTILAEMFMIKRRLIRLFELAYSVNKAWHAQPPRSSLGFFNSATELGRLVRYVFLEYLVQADPKRIVAAKELARRAGRPFVPYRFWRPAEALRQVAAVDYESDARRHPVARKNFVEVRISSVPPICTDATRLEWALKELFNNAIAATTRVTVTENGIVARPRRENTNGNAPPAITLTVSTVRRRRWLRTRPSIRLVIADNGVGIDRQLLSIVPLWAFSTQRDWIDEEPADIIQAHSLESRQLLIGGKGIGLAFARATITELGGEMAILSRPNEGTEVIIDLPVPTPFSVK